MISRCLGLHIARAILCAAGVFTLGSAARGFGEESAFECRGTELSAGAAAGLLGEVQGAYGKLNSLQAAFVQDSYLAALDVSERSSGTMIFERPGRMRWDYANPETQSFVVRDSTVWFYQPREKQVMIDEFRDVLISDIPVAFLMGLGNLASDFSVSRACPAGATTVLELAPRESEAQGQLRGLVLIVDGNRLPIGAKVTDIGGNVTSIRFTARKLNGTIPAKSFVAEVPPGTDVNDQRVRKGA